MKFNLNDIKIPKSINSPISKAIIEILFESNYPSDALYGFLFKIPEQIPELKLSKEIESQPVMMFPKEQREKDDDLKMQPYYCINTEDNHFSFALGSHSVYFIQNGKYEGWKRWSDFFLPILNLIQNEGIVKEVISVGNSCLDEIKIIDNTSVLKNMNCSFNLFGNELYSNFSFASKIVEDKTCCDFLISPISETNVQVTIICTTKNRWTSEDFFSQKEQILQIPHTMNKKVFFALLKKEFISSHFNPKW